MKARNESELTSHETVSVDSCTYYSRGKSGTRSLAERQCVYMYCPLYDEWLLFVYLCVCFISPLLLFDCVRLYRIAGKYDIMIFLPRLVVADFDNYFVHLYQLHVLFSGMLIQSYIKFIIIFLLPQRRASLQQRLSGDITDQDRRQLLGELEEVEGEIKKCVSGIQDCEGWIHRYENSIAEIRGEGQERQRKEGEGSKELYSTVSVDAHSCNHSYL